MRERPTAKDALSRLFTIMVSVFDGKTYAELDRVYQFVFSDIDDGWPVFIRFSQGMGSFHEGRSPDPTVTILTPSKIWLEIANGKRSPFWSLVTRKVRVQGKLAYLDLLSQLQPRVKDLPQSLRFPKKWVPPAKSLVFVGSPTGHEGFTYFYLRPFIEGLRDAGVEVEEILLNEKKIKPCLGCFACWTRTPGVCIHADDQRELIGKIDTASLIVYALPLYYFSVPGIVKNHLDRQLPMNHPFKEKCGSVVRTIRRNQATKQTLVLFSICGFPEKEHFDPLVGMFKACARNENMEFAAAVLLPDAVNLYRNPTEHYVLLQKLDELRSAGQQLARNGHIQRKTLKRIARPLGPDGFKAANWYWHNEMVMTSSKSISRSSIPQQAPHTCENRAS